MPKAKRAFEWEAENNPEEFERVVLDYQYVHAAEVLITETTGAGVYTASVEVPAGAWLIDVVLQALALWAATTSATAIVGDNVDPNGFYDAVDMKATDLTVGQSLSFAQQGGKAGAYLPSTHVVGMYSAAARTITAEITTVGAAGNAGRTRLLVLYAVPDETSDAVKVDA